jgi:CheY-like chemotaxis protein
LHLRDLETVAWELAERYAGTHTGDEPVDEAEVAEIRRRLAATGSRLGEAKLDLGRESKRAESRAAFTVLHVEDDAATLELVGRTLGAGVTVISAQDGATAVELAREHRPAVVLLDLQLPGASGTEVLRRLREDPATAEIPVVITSGGGAPGEIEALLAAGARAYVEKPLPLGYVRELVESLAAESA